jgi:hypothetical protein
VRDEGNDLVLNGRKWFITGAAHPQCQVLLVMCRNQESALADNSNEKHQQHSIVLVPIHTPGVDLVRNISVVHHVAPEGHCEIVLNFLNTPMEGQQHHFREFHRYTRGLDLSRDQTFETVLPEFAELITPWFAPLDQLLVVDSPVSK